MLNAISKHGETLSVLATRVGIGSSRHKSTDDWLYIRRQTIG